MICLDTNVLARFLLQDDPVQSRVAHAFLGGLTSNEPGYIPLAVVLELVWVLTSKNRFDRKTIAQTLDQFLFQAEIMIEQVDTVHAAIQLYRAGNADFADCLIASSARAAGCARTVTFDRTAAHDADMQLLT